MCERSSSTSCRREQLRRLGQAAGRHHVAHRHLRNQLDGWVPLGFTHLAPDTRASWPRPGGGVRKEPEPDAGSSKSARPGCARGLSIWSAAAWRRRYYPPGAQGCQIALSASVLVTTRPRAPVFVQVAEHLDADGLVQAAHADRFVAADADQLSDQVACGLVVGGVELQRALRLSPRGIAEQLVGARQRAERLDQPCSGRQQSGEDLA